MPRNGGRSSRISGSQRNEEALSGFAARRSSRHDAARFNQAPQSTARIPIAAVQPQRNVDHNPVFISGHEQPSDVTCTVSWPRWFSERFAQPTNPNTRHANPHNQTRRTTRGGDRAHWSGRRDSNPRPQPWQGCALPLSYTRILTGSGPCRPPLLCQKEKRKATDSRGSSVAVTSLSLLKAQRAARRYVPG
jgi:hypothetical protein